MPGLAAGCTSGGSIVVRDETGEAAPGSSDSVDPGHMGEQPP